MNFDLRKMIEYINTKYFYHIKFSYNVSKNSNMGIFCSLHTDILIRIIGLIYLITFFHNYRFIEQLRVIKGNRTFIEYASLKRETGGLL